ncbi:hypothetical protein [Serratia sp. BIGb0163]|uniref:endonuclease/exonuclease/phosphatase family protein n=1 Tax=Serratia sp. BIGb0163 TaxID=2940613 RepID=UPI00216A534A|nr:hypothetical protein [Serratia sp. BIGb0163]MCS4264932.1 exonuclease III [Serratia sp. BIGb0163]
MSILNIAFWNINIAPLFYSKVDNSKMKYLYGLCNDFFSKRIVDVLILCEVNEAAIDFLSSELNSLSIVKANDFVSKNLYFDMVMIHNHKIRLIDKNPIFKNTNQVDGHGYNIKTGYSFLISLSGDKSNASGNINIIASHWPSVLRDHSAFKKNHAARQLKTIRDMELIKSDRQVVLMGDYNEEPTSDAIKTLMYTTTNRHYAKLDNEIMYNLSDSMSGPHVPNYHGVDYHFSGSWVSSDTQFRAKEESSCKTFDQIMVPSSMISKGPWVVNERSSKIITNEKIKKAIMEGVIDHFPILLRLEKI